jgi:hypothetical protein
MQKVIYLSLIGSTNDKNTVVLVKAGKHTDILTQFIE